MPIHQDVSCSHTTEEARLLSFISLRRGRGGGGGGMVVST